MRRTYTRRMAQGHSVDEYLETIYFLAFPIGEYRPQASGAPTLASRVAEMLGVSRASAGEMLKRLEGEGLVERGERKEAILTPAGRERAERVVRRHRIIERLLTDFMGYTAAEAHVHADELGDTFTDEMIERIDRRLGGPERCPHGWPIDPAVEQAENPELAPLSDLEPGTRATIVRLAEHDGDLLHWFYDQGLAPGAEIRLESAEPAAGQFTVRLNGSTRAVGEKAAAGLFVRRAALRSASARSIRSQLKSWSSRPKWPYAAVLAKIGRRRSRSRRIAAGRRSKCSRTRASIRSTEIRSVPKVATATETGRATPIAYATFTSQRSARPAATTFFAT